MLLRVMALLSVFFLYLFFISSCSSYSDTDNSYRDSSMQRGKALASVYCGSCHLLPDPSLLDKKTWMKGVLPGMAPRLGIFEFKGKQYPSSIDDENISKTYYPKTPLLDTLQWGDILNYYVLSAPNTLPLQARHEAIKEGIPGFTIQTPFSHYMVPATSLVSIDTSVADHRLIIADAYTEKILFFNKQAVLTDSIYAGGQVVDICFDANDVIACNMGYMHPNDAKLGSIQRLSFIKNKASHPAKPTSFITRLARPVQIIKADLNQDKRNDYLICEFGNLEGALIWMEGKGKGTFSKHVLRAAPGAIKAIVQDYNHDGLPDILALFTQGEEGIFLFTNKGNGTFDEQVLLRFPPVYGSSSFELADFNADGNPDILYTCGDNGDYSPILKPYHGVYIFLNYGPRHYKQKYFFPIHGCFKALARDFDGDGDLDIATISFFPNPKAPNAEGFIYLQNQNNFDFQPYSLPQSSHRWLTMDAGDLDGNGKADIVLGNFNLNAPDATGKKNPSFLILKNIK